MVNPFLVLALGTCVSNLMSPFFPFNISQKEEVKKKDKREVELKIRPVKRNSLLIL